MIIFLNLNEGSTVPGIILINKKMKAESRATCYYSITSINLETISRLPCIYMNQFGKLIALVKVY